MFETEENSKRFGFRVSNLLPGFGFAPDFEFRASNLVSAFVFAPDFDIRISDYQSSNGFSTLTTVFYGDIVPVRAPARSLALLQMVSGTLFVAILIARLAGVYPSGQRPQP